MRPNSCIARKDSGPIVQQKDRVRCRFALCFPQIACYRIAGIGGAEGRISAVAVRAFRADACSLAALRSMMPHAGLVLTG